MRVSVVTARRSPDRPLLPGASTSILETASPPSTTSCVHWPAVRCTRACPRAGTRPPEGRLRFSRGGSIEYCPCQLAGPADRGGGGRRPPPRPGRHGISQDFAPRRTVTGFGKMSAAFLPAELFDIAAVKPTALAAFAGLSLRRAFLRQFHSTAPTRSAASLSDRPRRTLWPDALERSPNQQGPGRRRRPHDGCRQAAQGHPGHRRPSTNAVPTWSSRPATRSAGNTVALGDRFAIDQSGPAAAAGSATVLHRPGLSDQARPRARSWPWASAPSLGEMSAELTGGHGFLGSTS